MAIGNMHPSCRDACGQTQTQIGPLHRQTRSSQYFAAILGGVFMGLTVSHSLYIKIMT